MRRLIYLSHPEVQINPAVPVPEWRLSEVGAARLGAALARGWPFGPALPGWQLWTSPERKAMEAAALLAHTTGLVPQIHPGFAEVDRSATGYLPAPRHEALADALFASPDTGPEGWESAAAAQARVVAAFRVAAEESRGDLLLVGHGAVGTFLWCHLLGLPISRALDQPRQGCVWRIDLERPDPLPRYGWTPLETAPGL